MHKSTKFKLTFLIVWLICGSLFAADVDTVDTFSPSMNKSIKAVVITPEGYKKSKKRFPVVYLLHGYGSNYSHFIKAIPELKDHSDKFNQILVCPDGAIGSWYFDSPIDPDYKYETYISSELTNWIDEKYNTIASRAGRGITGFSMGGHGALYLAFKHQDIFGVAGSMSGGVDFRPFPRNWEIYKRLGTYQNFRENWEKYTVINMIDLLKPNSLDLIVDCGTEDFFYQVNLNFHEKLLQSKIPHEFIIRPGAHNWPYWRNSVVYQLFFMSRYFERERRD
jgi:S-formylglutathione hydrolase FrmB